MPLRRPPDAPPDRLAAVLSEIDQARRSGGWTPPPPDDRARQRQRNHRPSEEPDQTTSRRGSSGRDGDEGRHRRRQRDDDAVEIRPHAPLVRPPVALRDAVVAPGRVAIVAVLVLLIAAGAVLGGRLLWLRATGSPQTTGAPLPAAPSAVQGTPRPVAGAPDSGRAANGAGRSSAPASSALIVHVVGQVNKPGVVVLRPGARVRDAVAAAGGARATADLTRVNLARPVTDGEQVAVPKPGEQLTPQPGGSGTPAGGSTPGAAAPGGTSGASTAPVSLNQADAAALDGLPGIGPVLAGRIVQWRTDNGPFTSVDELGEVSGIGDKLLEQLRGLVTV